MNGTGKDEAICAETVPDGKGWVYFIGAGDAIKIGYSERLYARMQDIQKETHHNIVLRAKVPGDRALESFYHRKFEHLNIRGEWFCAAPEMWKEIHRINHPCEPWVRPGYSQGAREQIARLQTAKRGKNPTQKETINILIEMVQERDLTDDNVRRALINQAMVKQMDVIAAAMKKAA